MLRKNSGNLSTTYSFIKPRDIFHKIIISDNYDTYLDIKIRGKDAKLLLNYQWDKLNAVENLDGVDSMVASIRKVYNYLDGRRIQKKEFITIIQMFSETIQKNLQSIING